MANKLIIKNSVEPQIHTTETVDTKTYTKYSIEKNVDKNGGTFETTFADAKARKMVGVINVIGYTALETNAAAFEGTATTSGSAPSTVKAFYVKYDSVVGTVNNIIVRINSQDMAHLSLGESVCIPVHNLAIANCKIKASAYQDGVHEATATIVQIGD
tara:strand:- start:10 stop:483 length:474 start_codon:yes stop_codon:yes gene_type:complete